MGGEVKGLGEVEGEHQDCIWCEKGLGLEGGIIRGWRGVWVLLLV